MFDPSLLPWPAAACSSVNLALICCRTLALDSPRRWWHVTSRTPSCRSASTKASAYPTISRTTPSTMPVQPRCPASSPSRLPSSPCFLSRSSDPASEIAAPLACPCFLRVFSAVFCCVRALSSARSLPHLTLTSIIGCSVCSGSSLKSALNRPLLCARASPQTTSLNS